MTTTLPTHRRPRLSIIIPTLNEGATLDAQLTSLLGLWVCGVEIVVVDGGSQDDTLVHARRHASRVIASEPGRARQMNLGARASQGEKLLFLHADTHLPCRADRLIAQALDGSHCWGRFDIRLSGEQSMLGAIACCMNWRSRLTGIATGDQALFMTRAAFEAVNGYPDQPLMEDIEICKRLKHLSRPACLRARVVSSGRRWENEGLWATMLLMWRLRYRYWRGEDSRRLAEEYHHAR